jgi:iron complex transport system ATP-binding protein
MLESRNVLLRLGGRPVLRGVSLKLQPGRLVGVIGPNGAGKSSLLSVLAGLRHPEAGEVLAAGRPLNAWDRRPLARRRAVLCQKSRLSFDLPALEVVLMGRQPHHAGRETPRDRHIAAEALRAVDAEPLIDRAYLRLSGGEQQRVHLARALAQIWEPPDDGIKSDWRCLLLDEPVNHLDLRHQLGTLRLAKALCAEAGVAVLAVLHDLNLAARFADDLLVLHEGATHALGPTDETLTERVLRDVFGVRATLHRSNHDRPYVIIDEPLTEPDQSPTVEADTKTV